MMHTPTGVDANDVATTNVRLTGGGYQGATVAGRHARVLETIRQQPGAQSAGATSFLPLEEMHGVSDG
jgi:hypothetical protein